MVKSETMGGKTVLFNSDWKYIWKGEKMTEGCV